MKKHREKKYFGILAIIGMLTSELAGAPYYAFAASDLSNDPAVIVYEEEIPCDLQGMEACWTPDTEELELKEDIREHDIAGEAEKLKEGYDYVKNEVIFAADDEAYAKEVAAAYKAQLTYFNDGVAVISLDPSVISVSEAVRLGSDPSYKLPAVCPNYITYLSDPMPSDIISSEDLDELSADNGVNVYDFDWKYWNETYDDPALDPDYKFAEDPKKPDETKSGFQWMHTVVGSFEAWGMVKRPDDIIVAVLDSGIYTEHEDLKGQVIETHHVISENEVDFSGHGTHVAGIIAAKAKNGLGGVGIEPDAKLINIPVFDTYIDNGVTRSGADDAHIIAALNYVANGGNKRADIINMSIGGHDYNSLYQEAITNAYKAGVTICASMGNDGSNDIIYPAAYEHVIAVASTDPGNTRSDFSCYGSWADIAAPGRQVFSTWNGHDYDEDTKEGQYETDMDLYASWDGTSMACPVVAGVCANYMKIYGKQKPDDMEAILKKYATKVSDKTIGAGIVNMSGIIPSDTLAPVISAVDASDKEVPLTSLTENSTILLNLENNYYSGVNAYIYTLDGKKPAYKNGEATCGTPVYPAFGETQASISVNDLIDKGLLPSGETVTLMAMRLDIHNKPSKIATVQVKADYKTEAPADLTIFGPGGIAKGKSAVYTLGVTPSYIKAENVKWSVVSSNSATVNAKTGKVSVKKNSSDSSFILRAEMGGLNKEVNINILSPATGVTIIPEKINDDVNAPKKKKNVYTQLRLYNVDVPYTEEVSENQIHLIGSAVGNDLPVTFTSSAPAVASVDEDTGLVTAHHPGKAKITCLATDGSGKKASINIQVIVPASGMNIHVKDDRESIAYGKSAILTAIPGRAFGTPSITKVEWELASIYAYDEKDDFIAEVSANEITEKKLITVKNGKVSVSKKLAQIMVNNVSPAYFQIKVQASSTDGTGWYCNKLFSVYNPATQITAYIFNDENERYDPIKNMPYKMDKEGKTDFYDLYVYVNSSRKQVPKKTGPEYYNTPVCSSSNPQVASVYNVSTIKVDDFGVLYKYSVVTYTAGKANLTFKTVDGSNKKLTVKVSVIGPDK